jgi:hypothetical protein
MQPILYETHNMQIVPKLIRLFYIVTFSTTVLISCKKDKENEANQPLVVAGNGDITQKVNEFRSLLGNPLNSTPGAIQGRREINWDGVPGQFMNTSIPKLFFSSVESLDPDTRKRGFAYASDGDFRVSNAGFSNLEPSLSTQFSAFSGNQIFANVSRDEWHIEFRVPGELTPAGVNGFGAVFLDVDLASTSYLEFFAGATSMGKFFVPAHNEATGLSFLGVYFDEPVITSVKVRHGNGIIAPGQKDLSNGGTNDIVAMDDFLYSEPKAKE